MSDGELNENWLRILTPPKVVIIDIDDVQLPWAQRVHEACVSAGLAQLDSTWTQWHMWEDYGCTKGDWLHIVDSLVIPGGVYHGEPYPGVVEAIKLLCNSGAQVHFVTARGFFAHSASIREWTREWVIKHYPDLPISLWFAQDKGRIAKLIGATHALDDSIPNVIDLMEEGVDTYLMNQPHNAADSYFTPDHHHRVNSVNEFVERILNG